MESQQIFNFLGDKMPYNALNSLQKLVTTATAYDGLDRPSNSAQFPRNTTEIGNKTCSYFLIGNQSNSKINKRANYKYSKIFAKSKMGLRDIQKARASSKTERKSTSSKQLKVPNLNEGNNYWQHGASNDLAAGKAIVSRTVIGLSSQSVKQEPSNDARKPNLSKNQAWDYDFLELERQANLIIEPPARSSEVKQVKIQEQRCSSGKRKRRSDSHGRRTKTGKKRVQDNCKSSGIIYKSIPVNEDNPSLVPDLSKTLPVYTANDEENSCNVIDKYSQYVSQFRYIPSSQSPDSVNVVRSQSVVNTSLDSQNPNTESLVDKSSPVSEATQDNVSDSRTFLMSQEAYNQAQILGFAFNENQKQTKSSYAVDFKLCVVEWFINNGRNTSATAEKFQIDRKQVYSWHKERDKLKMWANKITNNKQIPSRRLVKKGQWSMYKSLDDRLFERCSCLNGVITVSNEALRLAAVEEAKLLGYNNFKASYIWLQMWKDRMERKHNLQVVLRNRRLIQWKYTENEEDTQPQ